MIRSALTAAAFLALGAEVLATGRRRTALDELRNRRRLVGLLTYVLLHLPQCREFGA